MIAPVGIALTLLVAQPAPAIRADVRAAQDADLDWDRAWSDLARLESMGRDQEGAEELARTLSAFVARTGEDPRGLILAARLERWSGRSIDSLVARLASRAPTDLSGPETWRLVELLPPGPAKVRAVLHALERTPEPTREELQAAWQTAVDETRAARYEHGALPIQRVLHARYQALWSAMDLGLTLSRLGRETELDALFADAIERARGSRQGTADLWARWGIAKGGLGDSSAARDYLGRALALGSSDGGLVLARMDLLAGRPSAARNGWRPSILTDPPASWAMRGWALTLLPAAHAPPRHGAGAGAENP